MTRIHVTNSDGWTRTFTPTGKRIIHIGSDAPRSDVRLEGVAGRQLSLIEMRTRDMPLMFGLTNLGTAPVTIHVGGQDKLGGEALPQEISSGGYAQLRCGDEIRVAGYRLIAEDDEAGNRIPSTGGKVAHCANGIISDVMQIVDFRLLGNVLRPDAPIEGWLTIRNTGGKDNVKFKIELMPKTYCTPLDSPIPVAAGDQQTVRFKIQQAREKPWRAGEQLIEVKVTAPVYIAKFTSHSCAIQVSPFYQHSIELEVQP